MGTYCFLEADCNMHWRLFLSITPNVLLDIWLPLVIGIIGMGIHVESFKLAAMEVVHPVNYVQYVLFMIVTAFFANFGYYGQFGIIVALFSLFCAVACACARFSGAQEVTKVQVADKWNL